MRLLFTCVEHKEEQEKMNTAIIRISERGTVFNTVPGPVWLENRPSHERLGLGCAILSEAACQGNNQSLDQNLLGRAEKLTQ